MRWSSLCGAAFKQGHRKLMNVRNCAIPHMLNNFTGCLQLLQLQTHAHIIYLWKALFIPGTMKYTVEQYDNVVRVHWRSNKVIINVSLYSKLRHFIIINGCYVFVSVFKATSYATGKCIVSSSNGLFHWIDSYRYIYVNQVEQGHFRWVWLVPASPT